VTHKRTHTGEKPFKCDAPGCGYACTTSGAVVTHKRTHTGEKPFMCDVLGCTYACSKSGNLVTHKRTHSDEKPFLCDAYGCTYACSRADTLLAHKRTHTGERPFVCDAPGCTYACSHACTLVIHKRMHTGEKPFACDHCTYKAIQAGNLRLHLARHEAQAKWQFACPMQDAGTERLSVTSGGVPCSIRCQTAFLLDYHVQRNHTADGLARKLQSETQMAQMFDRHDIPYERDHANRVDFGRACAHVTFDGNQFHSRPDFWLPTYSARLGATSLCVMTSLHTAGTAVSSNASLTP
jgi:hypothetical protein